MRCPSEDHEGFMLRVLFCVRRFGLRRVAITLRIESRLDDRERAAVVEVAPESVGEGNADLRFDDGTSRGDGGRQGNRQFLAARLVELEPELLIFARGSLSLLARRRCAEEPRGGGKRENGDAFP